MNTLHPPMHWHRADLDVHVATSDGEYAGFVATAARGIEAQDARGISLGTHSSVALAQRAVVTAWSPRARSPHLATPSRSQRPLRTRRRGTTGRLGGFNE